MANAVNATRAAADCSTRVVSASERILSWYARTWSMTYCWSPPGGDFPSVPVTPTMDMRVAERAQAACTAYGPPAKQLLAQARVFVRCLRQHGVNLPNPQIAGGRVVLYGSPDTSSARYRQAVAVCGPQMNQDVWPSSTS